MKLNHAERSELKSAILEVLVENKEVFKEVVQEVLSENKIIPSPQKLKRKNRLEAMINEDFDQYDEVFKNLA